MLGLGHTLSQNVADVKRVILLTTLPWVGHLLLSKQELLLLLLLQHSLLKNLLQLQLDLCWQWLDGVAFLVDHNLAFFGGMLLTLGILQQLNDLLGRQVISQVAELVASGGYLTLLWLVASRHLLVVLEVSLAFTILLLRRRFVDDSLRLLILVLCVVIVLSGHLVVDPKRSSFVALLLPCHLLLLLLQQEVSLQLLLVHHVVVQLLGLYLGLHLLELLLGPLVGLGPFALESLLYLGYAAGLALGGSDVVQHRRVAVDLGGCLLAVLAEGARKSREGLRHWTEEASAAEGQRVLHVQGASRLLGPLPAAVRPRA